LTSKKNYRIFNSCFCIFKVRKYKITVLGGVMRRYIFLLLFLPVLLLALESEPSEVVGYVKYECVSNINGDYNFIALPLNAEYTTASELGADYPFISAIRQWDPTSQSWVASDNYGSGFWFPDNTINPNEAILVSISDSSADIFIAGTLNSAAEYVFVNNSNGDYNAMMLPFEESSLTTSTALGEDIPNCTSIRKWEPVAQEWIASDNYGGGFWFPEFPVDTATAYFVTVDVGSTWPITRDIVDSSTESSSLKSSDSSSISKKESTSKNNSTRGGE